MPVTPASASQPASEPDSGQCGLLRPLKRRARCRHRLPTPVALCLPNSAQRDFERCSVGIRNWHSVRQLQMQSIRILCPLDRHIHAQHGHILDFAGIDFAR